MSESAYYARRKRSASARQLRDEQLKPLIEAEHAASAGTYGAGRITRALRRRGVVWWWPAAPWSA
ncbi:IS3 family transposase [Saccharopolyspora shandongensis]|uniref:IS3 family transposase n=1 Tax=Saccharopolyspora shandongensis TaxID=418495 RepID=UPI00341C79C2